MLIELTDASFGYGGRPVVSAARISLSPGQCLGVFGANGSGKSTLARGLVGLLKPTAGRVERRPGLRVGYLPQHRQLDPAWPMSGLDAALLFVSARRRLGWCGRSAVDAVRPMLERLGVTSLAGQRFATLSGGQQQRLLLAGALADGPQVLALDEPTEGLDVHTRQVLLACLREYAAGGGAVVLVSHEVGDLTALADAVAVVEPAEDDGEASRVEVVRTGALRERVMS